MNTSSPSNANARVAAEPPAHKVGKRAIRVAIIGGGFGGIAAAVKLKQSGQEDFVIFERSAGIGGTWWDNRYPGAETDAASHMYCYSFARYDWSRTHVGHSELRDYMEHVVDRFGLRPHFSLKQSIESVVWNEQRQHYVVTTHAGEVHQFEAVISAVGMFSAPRLPDLPGLDDFAGVAVHTATWDDNLTFPGKRVAVMGTGSSATQVVSTLAGHADQVYVFQRQPGWLLPKGDRDLTDLERRIYRLPAFWRLNRLRLYFRQERREFRGAFFRPGTPANKRAHATALATIDEVFATRPDLKELVTPNYPFGGKRAVLSSAFYQSLLRDDVDLVPFPVVSCTKTGVVDSTGEERPVDVLVMATGFQAASYLNGLKVEGRGGIDLHEFWDGEPSAFLGITVPGFPNFFILYGPNTNGGFIIPNLERQAAFAAKEIARLRKPGVREIEVSASVTRRYNEWLQKKMIGTAFTATDNYFQSASGKVVTQWPRTATLYAFLTVVLRRFSTRKKGAAA
ncbi:flavin-containing monooxygenase [Nakamurella antarctica]|uniref:flavin-containing monooxygenase n=1 Tax=Nakamurella antarctica TaxID=1902245 RepID=UPI0013DDFE98|nr:NAD(P)/FAD-dependent oxidoreductase [Nakamurella antarctica]